VTNPLDHIRIVLVDPKEPGNIGAVARAMKNTGLSHLYLVNRPDHTSGVSRVWIQKSRSTGMCSDRQSYRQKVNTPILKQRL